MPLGCPAQLSAVPEGDEAAQAPLGDDAQQWMAPPPPDASTDDDGLQPTADCPSWTEEQPAPDGLPGVPEPASEQDAAAVWPLLHQEAVWSSGVQAGSAPAALDQLGLAAAAWKGEGLSPAAPASLWDEPGPLVYPEEQAAAASPQLSTASSSSSSDLEWVLRVPSPGRRGAPGRAPVAPAAGGPRRSPSRLGLTQLRHLQSLRRQRLAQEAEALECLPAFPCPRSAAAAVTHDTGSEDAATHAKRAQGSPGGKAGRGGRTVHVSVRVGRRSPSP